MARIAKIKKFNKDEARRLQNHLNAVVRAEAELLGLDVKFKGGNFTDGDAVLKLQFTVKGAVESGSTREAVAFKRNAAVFGLKENDLGRSFTSNGKVFTISGMNTRAKAYPILAKDVNGKSFKFRADTVKRCLAS